MSSIPVIRVTKEEMRKRVALFSENKGFDTGLPDSGHPDALRTLYNVIGFQPPKGDPTKVSPVGARAAENASIKISEGFNLGFAECYPGKGPMMHNHDTNETFMPINGRWKCEWLVGDEIESFELGPCDVISFPAGVHRRFENITEGTPGEKNRLMFVIGGEVPKVEFEPGAIAELKEKGLYDFDKPAEQ